MSRKHLSRAATAALALGAIGAAAAMGSALTSSQSGAANGLIAPAPPAESRALPSSFASIIERVSPAVVSIRVTGRAAGPQANMEAPDMEIPEPFRRFFGEEFGKRFGLPFGDREDRPQRAPRVQGMGSGFFIDADGHLVTNNHVVGNAEKIEVMLKGGETLGAKLIGRDPKTDLALLKVESDRAFPFVRFGSSADARVGDWVIAVGSPFGLGHTATTGIVSARGRDIGAGPYDDFLQIDAAINKGNSGGPTFNVEGEVIGVNTAIFSPTGVSAGIGFAIPSDMAKNVIDQLRESGRVERGWLGVRIQSVTPDLADGLGLEEPMGALVSSVTKGGPAEKAGLRQGDLIVAVDGERVEKMRELPRLIAGIRAGKETRLTILRNGSERTVTVEIGQMPATDQLAAAEPADEGRTRLGMSLAVIDETLRARFGLPADVEGVVVVDVDRDGVAAEKGIRPGDVILRVAGEKVGNPGDVSRAVEKASDGERKAVLLLVKRGGNDLYVALPLRDA